EQLATVRIGYVYGGVYGQTSKFGYTASDVITGSRSRQEVALWTTYSEVLGDWDARAAGIGGWTLSEHHTYSPVGKVLYLGTGEERRADIADTIIVAAVGPGNFNQLGDGGPATAASLSDPEGITIAADGSYYIA